MRRRRKMCESTVSNDAWTATSATRPSPSAPERRSASVRCPASAACGRFATLPPVAALDEGGGEDGEGERRRHQHEGERAAEGPVRLADDLLIDLRPHDV